MPPLNDIQAALMAPGGGLVHDARGASEIVREKSTYRLGAAEASARLKKATQTTRLERLAQVREQEKVWAKFKVREFQRSVEEHHGELENQLRAGWARAREAKQKELDEDYANAAAGVGAAQRAAASLAPPLAKAKHVKKLEKHDDALGELERFERALAKEYARRDELHSPLFAARDRRVKADKLAADARREMAEYLERTAETRAKVKERKCLVENLKKETLDIIAKPLTIKNPKSFEGTHFNGLIFDSKGVAIGRSHRQGKYVVQHKAHVLGKGAPTAAASEVKGRSVTAKDANYKNEASKAKDAFSVAFAKEKALAEGRDDDLDKLRKEKAKEAKRANAAAKVVHAHRDMRRLKEELRVLDRAERKEKVDKLLAGGGMVHAPLLRKWAKEKKDAEAAKAAEDILAGRIPESMMAAHVSHEPGKPPPKSPAATGERRFFDDAEPFDDMFDDDAEANRWRRVEGAGKAEAVDAVTRERMENNAALRKIIAMAKNAETHADLGYDAEGAEWIDVAAVARGETAPAASRSVGRSAARGPATDATVTFAQTLSDDSETDSDDDFVGGGGGAGRGAGAGSANKRKSKNEDEDDAALDAAINAAAAAAKSSSGQATPGGGNRAAAAAAAVAKAVGTASAKLRRKGLLGLEPTPGKFEYDANATEVTATGLESMARDLSLDLDETSMRPGAGGGFYDRTVDVSDENTANIFSATMDDADVASPSRARAFGSAEKRSSSSGTTGTGTTTTTTATGTIGGGSSSSGAAEREMLASLEKTSEAMDAVSAAAAVAEATLQRAEASAMDDASGVNLPTRTNIPELKDLDDVLGALGARVRTLDAVVAGALSDRAPPASSSSGEDAAAVDLNTSALYAAASAAANNSAPPSASAASEAEAEARSPGGAAATAPTPLSEAGAGTDPYDLTPQRDAGGAFESGVTRNLRYESATPAVRGAATTTPVVDAEEVYAAAIRGGLPVDIAELASSLATEAVKANPRAEKSEISSRVAAAMSSRLNGGVVAGVDGPPAEDAAPAEDDADSSWARALGALDNEWKDSLLLPPGARANASASASAGSPTNASSSRYADAGDDSEVDDDAERFRSDARVSYAVVDDEDDDEPSTTDVDLNVAVEVEAAAVEAEAEAEAAGGDQNVSLSVDGRSLAALANALDAASFDFASDDMEELSDSEVEEEEEEEEDAMVDTQAHAPVVFLPPRARTLAAPMRASSVASASASAAAATAAATADAKEATDAKEAAAAAAKRREETKARREKANALDRKNRAMLAAKRKK